MCVIAFSPGVPSSPRERGDVAWNAGRWKWALCHRCCAASVPGTCDHKISKFTAHRFSCREHEVLNNFKSLLPSDVSTDRENPLCWGAAEARLWPGERGRVVEACASPAAPASRPDAGVALQLCFPRPGAPSVPSPSRGSQTYSVRENDLEVLFSTEQGFHPRSFSWSVSEWVPRSAFFEQFPR